MPNNYKLFYFDGRGRGEFIRYIFAQADVPYEDVAISHDDWQREKPKMPFGKVPVLEVDGKPLCQSTTIARYLAEKYGLAGKDAWTKANADMLVQTIEDIYINYKPYVVAYFKKDEAGMAEAKKVLVNETFKPLYEKYEKILGNNKYFCGDELTFADLAIAELSDRINRQFDNSFLSLTSFPNLKAHMIRIHELPNIKKYIEKRPVPAFDG